MEQQEPHKEQPPADADTARADTDRPISFFAPIDATLVPTYAPLPVELEPLFTVRCTMKDVRIVGHTGLGRRQLIPFTGLEIAPPPQARAPSPSPSPSPFAGAKALTDVGVDCSLTAADGVTHLDARYAFLLASQHVLYVQSRGTRFGHSPAATAALQSYKQEIAPSEYYFRLHLTLESQDPHPLVRRACQSLVIATAVRSAKGVAYDAYIVL